MSRRILLSLSLFVFFILVFFFQKIIFVWAHGGVNGGVDTVDLLRILYHGLSLDMSMSGYLTILPLLIMIASVWSSVSTFKKALDIYFCVALSLIAVITAFDVVVYSHWGFHLDPIVLFYLRNPKEALASGSGKEWFFGTLTAAIYAAIFIYGYFFTIRKMFLRLSKPRHPIRTSFLIVLLTGLLFLPIRGGVTVSTMNVSHAYFSERMFLNHAAINPLFNFIYSLNKHDDFGSQYQFYDKAEAALIFNRLSEQPKSADIQRLLRVERPNIILFILESFSYDVSLNADIAPNMTRFAQEGILFENFYANAYRTDRGLVSILSGYPAHPTAAILKYPKKTESLPAIPKYLSVNGYENQTLYYGGDVNFANMRSYFVGSCGIREIVSDRDFPVKERLTKWGVPDKLLIDRVYRELTETKPSEPFLKVILTLSSHEPFDVPTEQFDVPFLNAVNYTDECIGQFVSGLKTTALWDNTLIIFIADHAMQSYPQGMNNYEKERFQIPMIWIGGAVAQPAVISDYGSQNDLAATLLSQLQIDPSDFTFSKNMLHPQGRKFSFYAYTNGFCMIDSSGVYLYDNNQQQALLQHGNPSLEKEAKSFFQMMYIDLGKR